ncbi:MAG TPA: hypothetical protein VGC22_06075, partial [Chitinophaga sp.]
MNMFLQIPVQHPENFSFAECLRFLSRSDRECLHYVVDGHLQKMIAVQEVPLLLDITYREGDDFLQVAVIPPAGVPAGITQPAMEAAFEPVQALLTRWLHLDADLRPFYSFAAADRLLGPLALAYHGLRLIGIPDLFEAITWTVMGQQINLAFAYTMRRRFIETLGYSMEHAGRRHYLYPPPAVVAAVPPEVLAGMQFSRGKIQYIQHLARLMAGGAFTAEMITAA